MRKVLFMITLLFAFLTVTSQNNKQVKTFYNENNDSLVLHDNYAEFKFGNVIGGGFIKERCETTNSFEIVNDLSYIGNTRSTYSSNLVQEDENVFYFNLKDHNNMPIDKRDAIIYCLLPNGQANWAKIYGNDMPYQLKVNEIAADSLVYIDTHGYDPLKIKVKDLQAKLFTVVLFENPLYPTYLNGKNGKIECNYVDKTSLKCKYKFHKEMKEFEEILLRTGK